MVLLIYRHVLKLMECINLVPYIDTHILTLAEVLANIMCYPLIVKSSISMFQIEANQSPSVAQINQVIADERQ